jgi:hypothetical protein
MVASTLRKLSSSRLAPSELADLVQKHIGPIPTEARCREALDQLSRLKNEKTRIPAQVLAELADGGACDKLNLVLQLLRSK